jgi:aminopeptidase-like protein
MIQPLLDLLTAEFIGADALRIATEIQRTDRWSSWDRYRETATFCVETMRAAGLQAEWRELPSDGKTVCGDWIMPRAWDARVARLWLLRDGAAELLCDYQSEPCCLAMWSSPTPGGAVELPVVPIEEADRESAYEGIDVRGKLLFTGVPARAAKPIAIRRGAVGILSDHASRHARREPYELPDAVTWENSWKDRAQGGWGFDCADRECFGFLLSPRQGARFREWLRRTPEPRVRALVDTRLYDGTMPAVTGVLRGECDEQVLAIGHLFEQGAIDNASGPAVIMEGMRAIQSLIAAGKLPRPRRSIRALFSVECAGTYACAALQPELLVHTVAGVNVDCVGGALHATRAPLNLRRNPDATSSFTDPFLLHVLERSARRLDIPIRIQTGPWLLDDNLIADPAIGIPCPLIGTWPYPAYHNSADDPELLDPRGLAFAGIATAAYLYFLAAAGEPEARWLARLTGAAALAELGRLQLDTPADSNVAAQRRAYLLDRASDRLRSVQTLASGEAVLAEARSQEASLYRLFAAPSETHHGATEDTETGDRGKSTASLPPCPPCLCGETHPAPSGPIPRRLVLGSLQHSRIPIDSLDAWQAKLKAARVTGDVPDRALFWADGRRSIGEITWLVTQELGVEEPDLATFFEGLAGYGYVELRND